MIAEGRSTREIAAALWVTEETVKSHVSRVLRRLEARTRAHAVAIAYRDGLWAKVETTRGGPSCRRTPVESASGRGETRGYGRASAPSSLRAFFASAVRMSIGIGKTIVELFVDPISSSVCR